MSTDFVADQEVTAEDFANICVDLGATEYTNFSTLTPPLAVNELNKITMDLVSKGILLTLNRCQVTCDDNSITVSEGVCVFENGSKIRLTEPKNISKMADGETYVYFFNNVAESKAGLYAASEPPAEGDFVLLALVSADGVITDMRQYSSAKYVEMSGARYVYDASNQYNFWGYDSETEGDIYKLEKIVELPFIPTYVIVSEDGVLYEESDIGNSGKAVKVEEGKFYEDGSNAYTRYGYKLVKNGNNIEVYTNYYYRDFEGSVTGYLQLIFV